MSVGETVIRSRFNRVLAVIVWALCLGLLVSAFAHSLDALVRSSAILAFFAFAAWLALWRPSLTVSDVSVTAHNVTRTVRVPWDALIHIDTKYALTLVTPSARYPVWVAPAPGALSSQRIGRQLRKQDSADGLLAVPVGAQPGDLPGTESGEAARLIRTELQRRADAGLLPAGAVAEASVRWHAVHGAVAATLLAVAIIAAIV